MCSSLLGCSGGCIFNGIWLSWLLGSTWSRVWCFFLGCWVGPFMKAVLLLRKLPLNIGLDDYGALFQLEWFCAAFLAFWKFLATREPGDQIPQAVPSVIHGMTLGKALASSSLPFPSAVDVKTASHEPGTKIQLLSKDLTCSEVSVTKY